MHPRSYLFALARMCSGNPVREWPENLDGGLFSTFRQFPAVSKYPECLPIDQQVLNVRADISKPLRELQTVRRVMSMTQPRLGVNNVVRLCQRHLNHETRSEERRVGNE